MPKDGKARVPTRATLDQRTFAYKRFVGLVEAIQKDLGGEERLSTIELTLIEGFASAAIHAEAVSAEMLAGKKIDGQEHSTAISTMVRVATKLGTRRRPKDVADLNRYLRNIEADDDDDEQ